MITLKRLEELRTIPQQEAYKWVSDILIALNDRKEDSEPSRHEYDLDFIQSVQSKRELIAALQWWDEIGYNTLNSDQRYQYDSWIIELLK